MLALVAAHLVLACLLPLLSARSHRAEFFAAAVLPAAALIWAFGHAPEALRGGITRTTEWAPELGLALSFRLDALALVMIVLVSGLGALILVYSAWYFGPGDAHSGSSQATRSAALLLAFAGAMLGLVLADNLLTLYVFWEITSIASFLLIGQSGEGRENRRAAVQALLVTVFGGLAMLLGFVLLGEAAGTYRISEIVANPPDGPMVTAALVLILLGAFTKSAQLPFHPWLPAAMVAPTPVSAYLHAASMVKAGVYLVARLAPAFAAEPVWWVPVVVAGLGTMLIGGWRALQETDLKRLLAFGTVSQLGFLMVLLGAGGRTAALAGITMLLAHGLFKAPLFLVVGILDKRAGSRDVRELSGVGRALPGLAVSAALAAASMAGLPPLLGFVGKEAAFEAFLHDGAVRGWSIALDPAGGVGADCGVQRAVPVGRVRPQARRRADRGATAGARVDVAGLDPRAGRPGAGSGLPGHGRVGHVLRHRIPAGRRLPPCAVAWARPAAAVLRNVHRAGARVAPVAGDRNCPAPPPAPRCQRATRLRARGWRHRAVCSAGHRALAGGLATDVPGGRPRYRPAATRLRACVRDRTTGHASPLRRPDAGPARDRGGRGRGCADRGAP